MSILFATNFSKAAQAAASAAALLAARAGQSLLLVHVLPSENVRAFGQPLLEAAEGALQAEARRLEKLGARVERQLLKGEAPEEVARLAREGQVALVLTAAPTRETPYLGVGGTVDRLVQALAQPLLVVREAAPFEAWARGERALKVALGVDRSAPSEAARDWVKSLRALGPVELLAARIFWPQRERQRGEAMEHEEHLRGARGEDCSHGTRQGAPGPYHLGGMARVLPGGPNAPRCAGVDPLTPRPDIESRCQRTLPQSQPTSPRSGLARSCPRTGRTGTGPSTSAWTLCCCWRTSPARPLSD